MLFSYLLEDEIDWYDNPDQFNDEYSYWIIQHILNRLTQSRKKCVLLTAERDEAREWARKYKRMYEEASRMCQYWYDGYGDEIEINEELERKLKQATCEPGRAVAGGHTQITDTKTKFTICRKEL